MPPTIPINRATTQETNKTGSASYFRRKLMNTKIPVRNTAGHHEMLMLQG